MKRVSGSNLSFPLIPLMLAAPYFSLDNPRLSAGQAVMDIRFGFAALNCALNLKYTVGV